MFNPEANAHALTSRSNEILGLPTGSFYKAWLHFLRHAL
jgi:hypothetical protein